jgi:hypothetical protein
LEGEVRLSVYPYSHCWADQISISFRAAIEEDYAKRLAKLAKSTLGKDEVG